jgi:hypothetical protein
MVAKPKTSVFGMGSYNFIYRNFNTDVEDLEDYRDAVRQFLEEIDNLSNVKLEGLNSLAYFPTDPPAGREYINCPFDPCFGFEPVIRRMIGYDEVKFYVRKRNSLLRSMLPHRLYLLI